MSQKRTSKPTSKTGKTSGFVIGSARFRKISAVEGIKYSPGMKGQMAVSGLNDLTPEQRREAIIRAYRKKA
jgi:hypothetical protein